jgi:hypothetical protein
MALDLNAPRMASLIAAYDAGRNFASQAILFSMQKTFSLA